MSIMKNLTVKVLIAISLLCSASAHVSAQEYVTTPVAISTEKIKVDGKVCYSHVVLERQTEYSICKAYGVTPEDLYQYNPGLKENGLKKNSIIIIPSQEVTPEKPQTNQKYRKHTVKWYETLDDVAKKYGVTTEAIIELNDIQDPTAVTRMKILIPNTDSPAAERTEKKERRFFFTRANDTSANVNTADTLASSSIDSLAIEDSIDAYLEVPKTSVNFALLLPMAATGTTSRVNYMDFYCGVLYALYNSSNAGIETDIKVFDTENGTVPDSTFFDNRDFVIGPVFTKEFNNIMSLVPHDLPIVSPLDHRTITLTEQYPNLIQAPTHRSFQYRDLVKWLGNDVQEGDHIIYITETNARDSASVREMSEILAASGLNYDKFSYTILQGRSISATLLSKMTETGNNRVIIESESEAWVNDLVRNLSILNKKVKITLYSPSKIRSYESIDAETLYQNSLHVCLSYNINYDRPEVKSFLLKYRAIFHTEPTLFAFQGYDIATYFINLVNQFGYQWQEKINESKMSGLQATFDFNREDGKGYINEGIRRVEYFPDGRVVDYDLDIQ